MKNKHYKVINTQKPYVYGEYPSGGFEIFLVVENKDLPVSTAPDIDSVIDFIKLVSKDCSVTVDFIKNDI